ncbi:hypothetical protein WAE58_21740 [Pedobacter panaciterrae]|uniref:Uncharacterized protein n=1 Tax=Pedobacter panaciterrae TaxID=363849 RepID=A0ABU8NS39_9SPHI
MSLIKYAHIYHDAEIQRASQLSNVQNAQQVLEEYKNSEYVDALQRNLRLIRLADILRYEQELYEEKLKELGDAALDVIEELKKINQPIGKNKQIELPGNRYFELQLENEHKLNYLGPYSRA